MKVVSPSELQQRLGPLLETSQGEPVTIRQDSQDLAVLVSKAEYDRLRGARVEAFQAVCDRLAAQARRRGLDDSQADDLLADRA